MKNKIWTLTNGSEIEFVGSEFDEFIGSEKCYITTDVEPAAVINNPYPKLRKWFAGKFANIKEII